MTIKETTYLHFKIYADGKIYNTKHNRLMKQRLNKYGYPVVMLCYKGKTKNCTVHRLVAKAFIPNPDNKPQVNHINGIKTDNRAENLEWCTSKENHAHARANGLIKPLTSMKTGSRKLEPEQVLEIRRLSQDGFSQRKIATKFGVKQSSVYNSVLNNQAFTIRC